jgi:hypothetical protein
MITSRTTTMIPTITRGFFMTILRRRPQQGG